MKHKTCRFFPVIIANVSPYEKFINLLGAVHLKVGRDGNGLGLTNSMS